MRFGLFLSLVLLVWSCDDKRFFEANQAIENSSWGYRDAIVFDFDVEDSLQQYNLLVNLRHSEEFRYSNLWLFIGYNFPDGTHFIDTVECPLAYPDGKWLGNGLGDMRDARVSFRQGVTFPNSGEYEISIQHGMRNDNLDGISDVGLRIERAQ